MFWGGGGAFVGAGSRVAVYGSGVQGEVESVSVGVHIASVKTGNACMQHTTVSSQLVTDSFA